MGCPFHLAKEHHGRLRRTFSGRVDVNCLPFFPARCGNTVETVKVVETFGRLHERVGLYPFWMRMAPSC